MGQRLTRVNELLKREISKLLHTTYKDEAVCITITEVSSSSDLRHAQVFYSVFGDRQQQREAGKFLSKRKQEIRYRVGDIVTLKYLPHLEFIFDASGERGSKIIDYMDQVDDEDNSK